MKSKIIFSNSKDIPIEKLNKLFEAIGWKRGSTQKWKKVLSVSSYVVTAFDGNNLVGFGRILEDGVMCMFYDLVVHPNYQGQGIGTKIMENLIDKVKDKGYASIGLFAWEKNPKNSSFYKKFGFEKVDTGMELVKYIRRE
ncbi:GNAT family N-acetyltransferase [Patescibacteria group bacterium]|nr:GNAT family N-acetyltransferase [Patescibacteria group bacterium]